MQFYYKDLMQLFINVIEIVLRCTKNLPTQFWNQVGNYLHPQNL